MFGPRYAPRLDQSPVSGFLSLAAAVVDGGTARPVPVEGRGVEAAEDHALAESRT